MHSICFISVHGIVFLFVFNVPVIATPSTDAYRGKRGMPEAVTKNGVVFLLCICIVIGKLNRHAASIILAFTTIATY